jgi:predicted small metal-binding protein
MLFNWRASRSICILRFTKWTASMSNSIRIWIVLMSWDEYHEMKLFVNRSIEFSCWDLLLISWFARWKSEHDRWIDEFDWSKISWDYRASLLDLRETMRWLDVTYSYSRRGRNNFATRFRFTDLLSSIRAKLKLQIFDREYFSSQLKQKIKSFSIIIFVDDFDLYKNMYKILTNVYVVSVELSAWKRQKNNNYYTTILDLHDCDFNNIMNCFHNNLKNINHDCVMKIREQKKIVWASVITWLDDIKQQQVFAKFLSSRVTYVCRYCDANVKERENLHRDIIQHDRYHHQIAIIRSLNERIFDKIKRIVYLTRNELKFESFALKKLISTFDLIMSCSSDSTHNEYYDFVRRLCFILYFKIFITRATDEFIAIFQLFSFSSDWDRIQSSVVHIKSWSMNKCARAFVIISMLLRCWLQSHHVRQTYKNDLEIQISKKIVSFRMLIS